MSPVVRRVQPGDEATMKAIRLRSLLADPYAFGSTHENEAAQPDEFWAGRVDRGAHSDTVAMFLALDPAGDDEAVGPEHAVGMVGVFQPDGQTAIDLVSMWVAPEQRGSDLATRLVDAALAWSRDCGFDTVELWVTRGNDRAQRFYERLGFAATGETAPLPSDPSKDELRMRLSLR